MNFLFLFVFLLLFLCVFIASSKSFFALKIRHFFFLKKNKLQFSFLKPIKVGTKNDLIYNPLTINQLKINKELNILYKSSNVKELKKICSKIDALNEIIDVFSKEKKDFRVLNENSLSTYLGKFLSELTLPHNFSDTRFYFNEKRKTLKPSYLQYNSYVELPMFYGNSVFAKDLNQHIENLNIDSYNNGKLFDKLRNKEFQDYMGGLLVLKDILFSFAEFEESITAHSSKENVVNELLLIINDIHSLSEKLKSKHKSSEAFKRKMERI